jgi:hypothetical protein
MRRRLLAAAAALALTPAGAAAQGGAPQESTFTVPMEPRTIAVVAPLRDTDNARALYRSLVPRGFDPPAEPSIGVYLGEPNVPVLVPGQPYNEYSRWIEGPVMLRVAHAGREGWFPLAMPVSSQFEYDLGRAAGLPKILAEGAFTQTPAGFSVDARTGGRTLVRLDWQRRRPAGPSDPTRLLERVIRFKDELFTLFPALRGPERAAVKFTPNPPPDPTQAPVPPLSEQPQPELGVVRLRLDANPLTADKTLPDLLGQRGATLGDLVDLDQELPGAYWGPKVLLEIRTRSLGGGGGFDPARAREVRPRLVRRCVGAGRLRVSLRDAGGVRDVNFKFSKRTVARDTAAPFEQVVPRDRIARTRATRLRAVAYLRSGGRVVLARTLPRCGVKRSR